MTLLYPTVELHVAAIACLVSLFIGMAIGGAAAIGSKGKSV